MNAHLARLNPAQRQAAEHGVGVDGEDAPGGPLLVIAGAGSGKTDTLAHRVAHLLVNKADPRRILLLTFSRRAAAELARRVEKIATRVLGDKARALTEGLTWSGTFHAVGARLLREHAEEIGLDPAFTIHDREDSADLLNLCRHELGLDQTETRFPTKSTCLSIYSRTVNAEEDLDEVLRRAFPWCLDWAKQLKGLFGAYVEAKQRQGVLDYDDLLLYWAGAMGDPVVAAEIAGRFDHVLVDEYQDTNRLQASILMALKPDGRGLTVVGDDAQSIYSFRAATVRNILDFPARFDPPARIVTLEENYRSTQPILAAANAVISLAAERHAKTLRSDRASAERPELVTVRDEIEQARYVADTVLANREAGHALKSQAVLFRASHHSGPLEIELTARNIPFVKFGGLKFLEASHVKDVIALLRFATNPRDRVAGFRVTRLLPGIGPSTASRLLDRLDAAGGAFSGLDGVEPPPRAARDFPALLTVLGDIAGGRSGWPAEFGEARAWYEPHLERLHDDVEPRRADLAQLEAIAANYPSRERFLTDLTLDPPDATSDEAGPPLRDEDYLILSTIHSAKGQEWRSVFVLNCVDGCIPSDLATGSADEIEEERRLLYVAMTRAKDRLSLITPQRFFVHGQPARGDRHVYASRTRFIPAMMTNLFEAVAWPPPAAADPRAAVAREGPRVDLRARMRGMWG